MIAYDKPGAVTRDESQDAGSCDASACAREPTPRAHPGHALALDVRGAGRAWHIETCSTRRATLAPTAIPPDRAALHVELGAGGGDTVCLARALDQPLRAGTVRVRCYALTSDYAPVSLGLSLAAPGSGAWFEWAPMSLVLARAEVLGFDMGGPEPAGMEGMEIGRLRLRIVTRARNGFVVIERVALDD